MANNDSLAPFRPEEDEITLREVILKVREYWGEVKKNWWIVVLFCIPFTVWQIHKYYKTPVTYSGSLTFMVNEEQGISALSAVSGLLGSFGLGGMGENNYDRILSLASSTRIMRESILTKAIVDGKEDFLGNHFIRVQRLNEEKWQKPPKQREIWLKDFQFSHGDFDKFDLKEQTAVKRIIDFIVGAKGIKPVFGASLDKKPGIMSLTMETRSEALTIILLNTIFENLSNFYIDKSLEKSKMTYDIVKMKVDSMRVVMGKTEVNQAQFEDRARGLVSNISKVPNQRFMRDRQTQLLAYGEALKNLEVADFALKSNTPYIQVIDLPFSPLKYNQHRLSYVILIGLVLPIMLAVLFIIVRFRFKSL